MQPNELKMSISKVKMFARCPMQFYYSYIEGIKIPPNAAMVVGSATHKGLENLYLNKMIDNTINETTSLDAAAQYVDDADLEKEVAWDKSKDDVRDQAVRLVKTYIDSGTPNAVDQEDIEDVEKFIELELQHEEMTVPVTGIIDLSLKNKIVDFKTTKQTPKVISPEDRFQTAFYTTENEKPEIEVQYLVKLKTPKIVIPDANFDIAALRKLAQQMMIRNYIAIKACMESGNFIPAGITHPWACGYCGYGEQGLCPYYKFKEVA